MRLSATLLSESDVARVHAESLRILDEVGIRFHGRLALPLLRDAGARVDEGSGIARIPSALVEAALAAAPGQIVLGARNPDHDFAMPAPLSRYATDGTAAFAQDFETGERRYGTRRDIADAMRVFQAVDIGVMAWPPTSASDMPAGSRALHEFLTMARWSSKHGEHELHSVEQVPYLVDGLRAVIGDDETIRARHPYSLIYCPVAPLTHDGPMLDAYLELGSLDLPVMIMPMPVTGTTGPASLFGNVCLAHAEALSAIVVFELAHPGRPLVYSSATGSADFRSGAFLGGTPEMGLMAGALTTMGRSLGLPTSAAGCTTDAREPGPQAVLEKLLTTIPPVAAGADIIVGLGDIEGDQVLALEQILVDAEIGRLCERLVAGVDPAAAGPGLLADIAEVGPGGHFLAQPSTRAATRTAEFYTPALIDRHPFEAWEALGRPSMYTIAREEVLRILAEPVVDPLDEDASRELDLVLDAADRDLGDR
jgi:trimethylamine--corrinoid protein Co-methyltransferase